MLRVKNPGFKGFLIAAGVGVSVYLYVHDPRTDPFLPPCLILRLTGKECPSCGITRAYYHFLHGDLVASFHANALPYVLFPLVFLLIHLSPRLTDLRPWSKALLIGALLYSAIVAVIG